MAIPTTSMPRLKGFLLISAEICPGIFIKN